MPSAKKRAVGAILIAGGVALLRPGTRANKLARHQIDLAQRRLRCGAGRLQGVAYRIRGGHPDPGVIDHVLADRIRSSLGGLEKRLDVPRIHVMVQGHVAMLHGVVGTRNDADEIERAVAAVSGVGGVESYLHVGIDDGDTRPSAGRSRHPASDAYKRLMAAATDGGIDTVEAVPVVRAILATFAERLPQGERDQVAAHLPADVRDLFTPPRRTTSATPPRTAGEFMERIVGAAPALPRERAECVTSAVLQTLRSLVPEEEFDVAAVLPPQLRDLWQQEGRSRAGN